jgi:hypothetical protein
VDRWEDSEAERRRKLELTGVVVRSFWCKRVKLGGLVSFSGSQRCSRSTGSGVGSGSDGCRRRAEAAAGLRRGGELGKAKGSGNVGMGMQEWVCGKLQDMFKVQKKARVRGSSCWQAGGARGGSATAARRGGARRGPARAGKRRRGCWGGTWRGGKRCEAAGAQHMAGEGGGGRAEKKTEQGAGGRRRGLSCNIPKVQGLHYKA